MKSIYEMQDACLDKQKQIQENVRRQQLHIREKNKERMRAHRFDHRNKKKLCISLITNIVILFIVLILMLKTSGGWLYSLLCIDLISILFNSYFLLRIRARS